jgi:hypothetical protein
MRTKIPTDSTWFWKTEYPNKICELYFCFVEGPQETVPSPKILLWISFNFQSVHWVTSHKTCLPWDLVHSCLQWTGNTKTKSWIQLTVGLPVCFPLSNICLDIAGMKMGAQGPSQFASTMRPTSPVHFRSYTSPGILSYPILCGTRQEVTWSASPNGIASIKALGQIHLERSKDSNNKKQIT